MNQTYNLYIAMTLDGYIADKNDNLDWLMSVAGEGDNGYSEFYSQVDTVVMGRRTYDWIKNHMEDYPYTDTDNYIISSHQVEDENVTWVRSIEELKDKLSDQERNIWVVCGGILIGEMLNCNMISNMKVTIAPVLLGSGISLFNNIDHKIDLELIEMTRYNQFSELEYIVKL